MVFNSLTVGAAITPAVIETYISHYLNRKPLRQKPTAHVSYHEGINLIRQFLVYASHHTVEDIQGFTSQWVPNPRWVKVEQVTIKDQIITQAADAIIAQLGHHGIDRIGGQKWWQWRRDGNRLQAEWIEMRRDSHARKGTKSKRIMLYVHGGAYFFGSVDEHRYQLQRHARKLEARVFAPRYRLAPQFPFPCGLLDCLAAYLYLLTVHDPTEIVLAGDSAGGGMVVSLLVILRDRGLPLPAGAVLISPWVDLTHSFPSVTGDGSNDYIPSHGFLQRPSEAWPPPNTDDMTQIALHAVERVVGDSLPRHSTQIERQEITQEAVQGFPVDHHPKDVDPEENPTGTPDAGERPRNTMPGPNHEITIMIEGKLVEIKDQIQMYTTNQLVSHPLVSPVLQASLGGLPPLLILTGGGEVLRDEQIYLAHKAANPSRYAPGEAHLDAYPEARDQIGKWKPTDVQLQVWDDLCHVAPTLSFTRPAKFMYRSVAQFSAWALARAQKTDIEIQDDDDMSIISSDSESESDEAQNPKEGKTTSTNGACMGDSTTTHQVGKAGEPLPPFKSHMIRQRVDRHGNIFPLEPPSSLPSLQLSPDEIGVIKPGPVSKWLEAKEEWDTKYAREKRRIQKQRAKEMAAGYQTFGNDEVPPPSALAGRRHLNMPKVEKKGRSWGLSLWSLWGSSHDEDTIEREEKADKEVETTTATPHDGHDPQDTDPQRPRIQSRSKSRRRTVSYIQQDDEDIEAHDEPDVADPEPRTLSQSNGHLSPPSITYANDTSTKEHQTAVTNGRPIASPGKAFPFKLGRHLTENGPNASTVTLQSYMGVGTANGGADEEGQSKQPNGTAAFPNGVPHVETGKQTMEDDKGVLYAATPAVHSKSETGPVTNGGAAREEGLDGRPGLERFETAKQDV